MTKVILKEEKIKVKFGDLEIGDCFLDEENHFCIKVNPTTCLVANEDLASWEEYDSCNSFEEVYPIDVEIHIIS